MFIYRKVILLYPKNLEHINHNSEHISSLMIYKLKYYNIKYEVIIR
jgi:hypothetical protein